MPNTSSVSHRCAFGLEERHAPIRCFVFKRNARHFVHMVREFHRRLMLFFERTALSITDPDGIDNGMQHFPTTFLGTIDGLQEKFTSPSTYGFMCFNTTKTSVSISCVTKTRDKEPFESVLLTIGASPLTAICCLSCRRRSMRGATTRRENRACDHMYASSTQGPETHLSTVGEKQDLLISTAAVAIEIAFGFIRVKRSGVVFFAG